jgi:hypothetical protein
LLDINPANHLSKFSQQQPQAVPSLNLTLDLS